MSVMTFNLVRFFMVTVVITAVCIVVGTSDSIVAQNTCFSSLEELYFRALLCKRILCFCLLEFMMALDSEL